MSKIIGTLPVMSKGKRARLLACPAKPLLCAPCRLANWAACVYNGIEAARAGRVETGKDTKREARGTMVDLKRTELRLRAERAVLIQALGARDGCPGGDTLSELRSLARTAGAVVVGELIQRSRIPQPSYYLGKGKLVALEALCKRTDADVVICDDDLTPAQVKTLESALDTKAVDRTELILDIFATHARTKQAKLQVELAQLEYALPRLTRMWSHLDRTAGGTRGGPVGGGVGVRGPGEKQLEVDRRLVEKNIHELKKELQKIEKRRRLAVGERNRQFVTAALVGYTNAGKSSIMNALTDAGVSVRDRLFETLDTRTRAWRLPDGREVMLSDTVGFIRKLPHDLIASFHATLEEALEADILLHVIDASSHDVAGDVAAVQEVLAEIGCADRPQLPVLNKMDLLQDDSALILVKRELGDCVAMSAVTGQGLDAVTERVGRFLDQMQTEVLVEADAGNGRLVRLLYERGAVLHRSYEDDRVRFRAKIPSELIGVIEGMGGRVHQANREAPR